MCDTQPRRIVGKLVETLRIFLTNATVANSYLEIFSFALKILGSIKPSKSYFTEISFTSHTSEIGNRLV